MSKHYFIFKALFTTSGFTRKLDFFPNFPVLANSSLESLDSLTSALATDFFLSVFFSNFLYKLSWFSCTCWGVRGNNVTFLCLCVKVYLLLTSSKENFLSYYQGLPSITWCIGTTSHKILSSYLSILKETSTCLKTQTSLLLLRHYSL